MASKINDLIVDVNERGNRNRNIKRYCKEPVTSEFEPYCCLSDIQKLEKSYGMSTKAKMSMMQVDLGSD